MKKIIVAIILVSMLAVLVYGCAGCDDQTQYIGIISAMDNEIAALLEEAEIDRVDEIGGIQYHVGTLRGQHVVITKSGIGKVRASAGVTSTP